jgi:hypothetical protein
MIVQDKEHRTDDCHGKISHELLNQLRQSEDFAIPANTPFQFRAGITNQRMGSQRNIASRTKLTQRSGFSNAIIMF